MEEKMTPRRTRPGHWGWFDLAAFERAAALGSANLAVYAALCALESRASKRDKLSFEATRQAIAEAAGVSVATVKRVLPALQDAGLIDVKTGGNFAQRAHKFCLLNATQDTKQEEQVAIPWQGHHDPPGGSPRPSHAGHHDPALTITDNRECSVGASSPRGATRPFKKIKRTRQIGAEPAGGGLEAPPASAPLSGEEAAKIASYEGTKKMLEIFLNSAADSAD